MDPQTTSTPSLVQSTAAADDAADDRESDATATLSPTTVARPPPSFLVITNIQKRANIRHLLSTAVAFGVQQVFVVGQEGFQFHLPKADDDDDENNNPSKNNKDVPTLVQQHMRSQPNFVQRWENWHALVAHLDQQRIRLVGVEIHPDALSLDELLLSISSSSQPSSSQQSSSTTTTTPLFDGGTAFLVGNEGQGINAKHQRSCQAFVRIPQYGVGTASLNVYVASSIVLQRYHQWQCQQRQRQRQRQQHRISS